MFAVRYGSDGQWFYRLLGHSGDVFTCLLWTVKTRTHVANWRTSWTLLHQQSHSPVADPTPIREDSRFRLRGVPSTGLLRLDCNVAAASYWEPHWSRLPLLAPGHKGQPGIILRLNWIGLFGILKFIFPRCELPFHVLLEVDFVLSSNREIVCILKSFSNKNKLFFVYIFESFSLCLCGLESEPKNKLRWTA